MKKILFAVSFVLILGIIASPAPAFADRGRDRGHRYSYNRWDRHHHRPHYYYRSLPHGYFPLRIADSVFYYLNGIYYQETPSGYIVVSAPRGALIRELPPRHKRIAYGNKVYFFYNNAYYVQAPEGYSVVTPPPQVVTQNPPAVEAPEQTIVVTVPNPNGSYVPVTLKKYSDGYVGPNGEFYPDYPTIDQLKAMYSIASAEAEPPLPEELEFQVPNKNGSFTKVVLDKTKDGYVGPEGEYYKEKPTMKQLEEMYAK